jgi:YebC/PmpR family DNA-binding regulatory protein
LASPIRGDAGQVALDVGAEDRHAGAEKPSAMICSVTVLPVPVAPVMRPCRLARLIMVDCLTDNKTRTVAEVRHAFAKHGGNMGTDGCVAFQFKHCGQMLFAPGTDEAALMDAAIEAGADDVITNDDGSIEVITPPADYISVKEALEAAGFTAEFGQVTMKAENETELTGDDAEKMQKLLDVLESLDDVQEVYTSVLMDSDSDE